MERAREELHIFITVESDIALIGGVTYNTICDNLLSMFIFLGKKSISRA